MAEQNDLGTNDTCYLIGAARAKQTLIGNQYYYLVFNGYAYFELQERFGAQFATHFLSADVGPDIFADVADAVVILARQGELARRAHGLDERPFLERQGLEYAVTPLTRADVFQAIALGFEREIKDENEEIDLILLEKQKKS